MLGSQIAIIRWKKRHLHGPIVLASVPISAREKAFGQLERISMEHQWGNQSLLFLAGAVSVLLDETARFRVDATFLEAACAEPVLYRRCGRGVPGEPVALAVLQRLTCD
jgi:hypothetical protein